MSELLYNGIELPVEWPPRNIHPSSRYIMRVPYLEAVQKTLPIDTGRQLFVDDFLIESTSMTRVFHQASKYTGNPVFSPATKWEKNEDTPPCTIPKCGGVWYDERDGIFKMWYMASYLGCMCYATSQDGIHWDRPELDVVPGTNIILPLEIHPDSGTVWIDRETSDKNARYKMLIREPNPEGEPSIPGLMMISADGIHWSDPVKSGYMHDRSTMFYNPFRKKWVQSIRSWVNPGGRYRHYWEHADFFESGEWQITPRLWDFRDVKEPVAWAGADYMDKAGESEPQLYNLDAVAYESLMISFFQILQGPPNQFGEALGLPKLTELTPAYSRDGFHWYRPDRRMFISANRTAGSWEYGYVESTGGLCLVVGDELWFYYSAYAGDFKRSNRHWSNNGMYANGAVGLAKLRRDGFASMQAKIPGATLTTKPVTFKGKHLFVNAMTAGSELAVEVLNKAGEVMAGFTTEQCHAFCGNSTCAEITWSGVSLESLAGSEVAFRFSMDRGEIYSFWVSPDASGASYGYVGAGGPGFKSSRDTVGKGLSPCHTKK